MYPTPQDNPHNCPVCGFRPCADECRLGLSRWDVEILGDMFGDDAPPPWSPDVPPAAPEDIDYE